MKIVCLSDTHGMHRQIKKVPAGDVLVVAGDMTDVGELSDLASFADWLGHLPHKHKLIVAGNHDWNFRKQLKESLKILGNTTYPGNPPIYLEDSGTIIDGVKFYGSPWQPEFMGWAFNLPRDGEDLKEKWSHIPYDVDVLITHCPPEGILDNVSQTPYRNGAYNLGCHYLLERVKHIKPKLHIFGHIHDSHGKSKRGKTTFINASICNEDYMTVNKPIVVNIAAVAQPEQQ